MPLFNLFWTMFMLFMWIIWFWLLITIFADIFRNKDMSGGVKAVWTLFVIILPFLGVLIYIVVNGNSMQERQMAAAAEQEKMARKYIQEAAGGGSADELAKLADLHAKGVLTDEEFAGQKAKLLG